MSEEIEKKDVEQVEKPAPDINVTPDKDGKDPIAALRKSFLGLAAPREVVTEKPKKAKADPAKPEKAPVAEEKPTEAPAKEEVKEGAPEPVKVKKVARQEPVAEIKGAKELAETAQALKATAEAMNRKPEEKAKPTPRALPPNLERKLPDLKALAELHPDKFKDIEDRTREFYGKGGKEDTYKSQWKKENPGKQFDDNDPEHEDFYNENEPFIAEEDLEEAKEYRIDQRVKAAVEKQTEPIKRETRMKEAREASVPVVQQFNADLIKTVATTINPELTGTPFEKWEEADPLVVKVMNKVHDRYTGMATALGEWKVGIPYDPKNKAHVAAAVVSNELADRLAAMDQDLLVIPVQDKSGKVIGHQSYVPPEEYGKATPERRRGLWTITEEVVMGQVMREFTQDVRSFYDDLKPARSSSSTKTGVKAGAGVVEGGEKEAPVEKIKSPDVGSGSPAPVSASASAQTKANVGPNFAKGFLGG